MIYANNYLKKLKIWKAKHPNAMKELEIVEGVVIESFVPGADGSLATSRFGQFISKLSSTKAGIYAIYPLIFAAGALSVVALIGLFQSINSSIGLNATELMSEVDIDAEAEQAEEDTGVKISTKKLNVTAEALDSGDGDDF
jgi:hypothetical protein